MRVSIDLKITRRALVISFLLVLLCAAGVIFFIKSRERSPLPASVKSQVTFSVVYPPSRLASTDAKSFSYQDSSNVLTFTTRFNDANVTFSEQPAPESLGSETQAYYPVLGIHPYAIFKTDLGSVALTKFWQSGSLEPVGQAGVLASHGTLTIAHSDKNLTNQQWKDLFESLKTTR